MLVINVLCCHFFKVSMHSSIFFIHSHSGGDLLNEQPWPMDLSALNSTLDVTFSRQLGADILTRCFHLKSTDIDCITAESVKAYISESAFFTKRFARAKVVCYYCSQFSNLVSVPKMFRFGKGLVLV